MGNFRILLVYPNLQMINLLPSNVSLLAACLKERGFAVDLFDTTFYPLEEKSMDDRRAEFLQVRPADLSQYGIRYKTTGVFSDFRAKVKDFSPDLIAITMVEDTFPLALALLREVRGAGIPVIAGGVHVTLAPDLVLAQPEVDMICRGEGEEALPEVCERLRDGRHVRDVRNIWLKEGENVMRNPMRPLVDLDTLPYNDFTLFQKERFFRPMQGKVFRMVPIEIDRGCPYQCTYCSAPALKTIIQQESGGRYYRIKSIGRIIRELEHQVAAYGAEYVYFNSETFLAMPVQNLRTLADHYIEKIHLPFWCQSRIETISDEKLTILEEMGCDRLSIGIEHGNEEFRAKVLRKSFTNRQVLDAFRILARHRIPVTVNNMLGFPDETRELVFDTIRLNRAITADSINCFIFTPYHGTHLREVAVAKGYLEKDTLTRTVIDTTLTMPALSRREILGLLRTFPLYIKLDEEDFPEIACAEHDTQEGNAAFERLAAKYRTRFWGA
jgi:radical SAM superfamily enzyme YgiQ (UPF0313 family)